MARSRMIILIIRSMGSEESPSISTRLISSHIIPLRMKARAGTRVQGLLQKPPGRFKSSTRRDGERSSQSRRSHRNPTRLSTIASMALQTSTHRLWSTMHRWPRANKERETLDRSLKCEILRMASRSIRLSIAATRLRIPPCLASSPT